MHELPGTQQALDHHFLGEQRELRCFSEEGGSESPAEVVPWTRQARRRSRAIESTERSFATETRLLYQTGIIDGNTITIQKGCPARVALVFFSRSSSSLKSMAH